MVFSQQNILCINERWPGKALLRTTNHLKHWPSLQYFRDGSSMSRFTFTPLLRLLPGRRKEEEEGIVGRGNVRQWPWWGEEGRQVTSQWYHGISSSTWPAPAASWAAAYYNSRHLSRSSSCWTLQPMANDQYNVCSTSYEAAAVQCTMAITYIVRRRKGLCTTKIQPKRYEEDMDHRSKRKNQSSRHHIGPPNPQYIRRVFCIGL